MYLFLVVGDTNDRSKQLDFVACSDCVLSGFAGYFESELFGGVMMSILPSTFTEGMLSWFPIYFPIRVSCCSRDRDETNLIREFTSCFYFIPESSTDT